MFQLEHALRVPVGGTMQADRIAAEDGGLAAAGDAVGPIGNARMAGATHDPLAAAGRLLGFHADEQRPLPDSLPPRRDRLSNFRTCTC